MQKNKWFQWQVAILLGVFTLSLMVTTPAFADEVTPPEEPVVTEQGSGEENAVVEESTTTVETEAGNESTAPVETVAEILEQLPEDTSLIVVDESGEALPLASEAAEEAIIIKDPIWCPAGVLPKPGLGGCSSSFGSLSLLVAGFIPPAKNGVIWIESGTDSALGGDVVIDGLGAWALAANYSLTLQGGWIGPAGPPVGSMAIVGTTIFDTAISIVNWNGAVTINDISFENADNTAYSGTGSLYVETSKNIVVSNVMVINSAGALNDGAYLDNRPSTTQATVTVKNSTFNGNIFRGLTIYSDGAVTLTNVSAHFNGNDGAYIQNNFDGTASVVSVTKGFFNQNGDDGLTILSNGAVKLSQISASTNTTDGVEVDNISAPTPQAVTVSGFLSANSNGARGLSIVSDGAVTLTTLTTDNNSGNGVNIQNTGAAKPYAVTINGFNSMSNNAGIGLLITSLGTVTVNNIVADFNGNYGAYISNASDPLYAYGVNVKGVNSFNLNAASGLYILSRGAISTYNLTANTNGYIGDVNGVYLVNSFNPLKPQNITLFGVNTINYNSFNGLYVESYGIITLNNITANFNGEGVDNGLGSGADIGNSSGSIAKPVILKGTNTFIGNDGYGLIVFSLGAISVSNVTANFNDLNGVYLDNNPSPIAAPITITGYGIFNNNAEVGLQAFSNGAITTNNLSAQANGNTGVYLETIGVTKVQAVNMKGNNTFIGNGNAGFESGLVVFADGNITVNNLTASQNYSEGAVLDNLLNWTTNMFVAPGSVNITGFGNFHNNGNTGLFIYTQSNVTMSYITANQNGFDGVAIDAKGKVTLTCVLVLNNVNYGFVTYNQPVSYITIKGLSAMSNFTDESFFTSSGGVRSRCL
jgi:hypothetical protein